MDYRHPVNEPFDHQAVCVIRDFVEVRGVVHVPLVGGRHEDHAKGRTGDAHLWAAGFPVEVLARRGNRDVPPTTVVLQYLDRLVQILGDGERNPRRRD